MVVAAEPAVAERFHCKHPLRAGMPSFGLMHNPQNQTGIDDDVVAEPRHRSGCRIDTETVPVNRGLRLIEAGALDQLFSVADLPARRQYGYVIHYGALKNHAITGPKVRVSRLDDFIASPDLTVGIIRGATYGPVYDEAIRQLRAGNRVYEASDIDQLYQWLGLGRIDLIFAESVVYVPKLKSQGIDAKVRILDWAPGEKPLIGGLLMSKRTFSPGEAQAWQALFNDMRHDGTLRQIFLKYLPPAEVASILGR
jgi:polar amino acid transport system substrate-binding protein